ncbi:hypothetical protein Tco_1302672 [Tanacetum coccineum]
MSNAAADVDTLDFEADDDDLMEEDALSPTAAAAIPKLKSAITGGAAKKTKGRGFRDESDASNRMSGRFDSLDSDGGPGPERC